MKLLAKFNLVYLVVMSLGIVLSGYIARSLLQGNAQQEVVESARMLMEKAVAVRNYTNTQVKPLLVSQMAHDFLPQTVPSYAATEVLNDLLSKHPEFAYKEATLNPTNPRDRATSWEVDIVGQFRSATDLKETVGTRDTPAGPSLYIARPMRITDPACLACHSSVDAAPATMVAKYGPANGFGWNLNEIIGAQIVSVPLGVPLQRADQTFKVFITSLVGVFIAVGVVLNVMVWMLVVRPVTRLSALADRVSQGDLDAPEFKTGGRDEIATLSDSFSRMRASVVQAMKLLDS
ncbi:c-type heme family protein [Roseateles sp.]|uniref:Tll0287-like domain-containing protein n=1 Tax=Roseateles sp. TaxID=1971397 RepID=UPI003BA84491